MLSLRVWLSNEPQTEVPIKTEKYREGSKPGVRNKKDW